MQDNIEQPDDNTNVVESNDLIEKLKRKNKKKILSKKDPLAHLDIENDDNIPQPQMLAQVPAPLVASKDNQKQNESAVAELVKSIKFDSTPADQKSNNLPTVSTIQEDKQPSNQIHRETPTKHQNTQNQHKSQKSLPPVSTNTQTKIFLQDAVTLKELNKNYDNYDEIEEVDSIDEDNNERDEKKLHKIYSLMVAIIFLIIFLVGTILAIVLPKVYR